eukprot:3099227-Rhodomonas_salina.1
MSRKVKGLPRSLSFHSALCFPCCCCSEAKAKRQPYLPASETQSRHEDYLMTWDMFYMGEKHLSLSGNRYILVFLIHCSRFAITLLHKDCTLETTKSLLISVQSEPLHELPSPPNAYDMMERENTSLES